MSFAAEEECCTSLETDLSQLSFCLLLSTCSHTTGLSNGTSTLQRSSLSKLTACNCEVVECNQVNATSLKKNKNKNITCNIHFVVVVNTLFSKTKCCTIQINPDGFTHQIVAIRIVCLHFTEELEFITEVNIKVLIIF